MHALAFGKAWRKIPCSSSYHNSLARADQGAGEAEHGGPAVTSAREGDAAAQLRSRGLDWASETIEARREAGSVAAFARRELTWDRAAEEVEGIYREALGSIV